MARTRITRGADDSLRPPGDDAKEEHKARMIDRAQGCLLGQLAGDSLGALVEFRSPEDIRREYPGGVRDLTDGGTWNTIAGQPTDDSEMALSLARMLADQGRYDPEEARKAYIFWLDSAPFDCGMTVARALRGHPSADSQANGAMMRVSPLGIFGANHELELVAEWAQQDAAITHPHPVCREANALFTMAIAHAVRQGCDGQNLYQQILTWAQDLEVHGSILEAVLGAAEAPPADYVRQQGWVLTALRNALWQLLHASNLEEAIVDTVMRGGDTDTNAAICGALLGAVYSRKAVPGRWVQSLLHCRPAAGQPNVHRPRPKCFWPVDALELAKGLLKSGELR